MQSKESFVHFLLERVKESRAIGAPFFEACLECCLPLQLSINIYFHLQLVLPARFRARYSTSTLEDIIRSWPRQAFVYSQTNRLKELRICPSNSSPIPFVGLAVAVEQATFSTEGILDGRARFGDPIQFLPSRGNHSIEAISKIISTASILLGRTLNASHLICPHRRSCQCVHTVFQRILSVVCVFSV